MPGLSSEIKTKMSVYLGPPASAPDQPGNGPKFPYESTGKRSKCKICIRECHGAGYTGKKDDLSRMTTQCQKCEATCCKKHLIMMCGDCAEKADFPAPAAANPPRREID